MARRPDMAENVTLHDEGLHSDDEVQRAPKRLRVSEDGVETRATSLFMLCFSKVVDKIERVPSLAGIPPSIGNALARSVAWRE